MGMEKRAKERRTERTKRVLKGVIEGWSEKSYERKMEAR